jgi:hypothetical protein
MPIGLAGGLPTLLPGTLRSLIRSRDLATIRGVLSTLAVFRIMKMPCKLKLESITNPFEGLCDTLPAYEIIKGLQQLKISVPKGPNFIKLSLVNPFIYLSTAGPNHPVSMLGI